MRSANAPQAIRTNRSARTFPLSTTALPSFDSTCRRRRENTTAAGVSGEVNSLHKRQRPPDSGRRPFQHSTLGFQSANSPDDRRREAIYSDLGLPGIDGYALLRAIRAKTAHRTLAAVAVTAYARPDDRARPAAGFDAYVSKPVDPAELVRTLVAVLAAPLLDSGHERDSHADAL